MSNSPVRSGTDQTKTHRAHKNRWAFIFRFAVTALIVGFLAQKINWPEFATQLLRADYIWLTLACFLFGIVYLLAALRWWFLIKVQKIHLPLQTVIALTFIGQFFNSFLLGAIGGDLVKAVYLQKYAPNQKTHGMLSIIMDRVLGLLILICASLVVIPLQFQHLMTNQQTNAVVFGLLIISCLCVGIGLAMLVIPFHRVPSRIKALWRKVPYRHIAELVVSGFRQHGSTLSLTLASLTVGILMTAVLVAAGYYIGLGIGLVVTYVQMLVILTVVICVISLPISIGGHGVREGVFVIMFAAFGATSVNSQLVGVHETAILFSILFYAIPLIWSLVGGIIYLLFRHDYGVVVLPDDQSIT